MDNVPVEKEKDGLKVGQINTPASIVLKREETNHLRQLWPITKRHFLPMKR
jgi:hypothetical protein